MDPSHLILKRTGWGLLTLLYPHRSGAFVLTNGLKEQDRIFIMHPVLKKPEETLRSSLTLWDAVALVVSGMVGSGIFMVSSQVAVDLQSGLLVLSAWVFTAVMSYFGALAFGELACLWPQV